MPIGFGEFSKASVTSSQVHRSASGLRGCGLSKLVFQKEGDDAFAISFDEQASAQEHRIVGCLFAVGHDIVVYIGRIAISRGSKKAIHIGEPVG